jgi:hypothetical protein
MKRVHEQPRSRRAVALLFVIGVLVVSAAAMASFAARRTMSIAAANSAANIAIADDLLLSAAEPISRFLDLEAGKVILPPEVDRAEVIVVDDTIEVAGRSIRIAILAVDQCAAVPFDRLQPGSPLRTAVPAPLHSQLDEILARNSEHPGLDALKVDPSSPSPFPSVAASEIALGHVVRVVVVTPPRININTATRGVLETVLRELGQGGLDVILEARAKSERAAIPKAHGRTGSKRLALASTSDSWAFRIDLTVDSVRRSWWEVHSRTEVGWTLTQRCAIRD